MLSENLGKSGYWRDIGWQALGNTLAQVIGVLGIPVLTRLYTPESFAIQSLFIQVVMFATGVMTLRYEYFVQLPGSENEASALHQLVLILGFFSTALLTPLVWVYRIEFGSLLGNENVALWLVGTPVTALLVSWAIATQHLVQRRRNFRISGLSELVGKGAYIGSGVTGAIFGIGPAGLVITTAFSAVGKLALLSWAGDINENLKYKLTFGDALKQARVYMRLASSMVMSHIFMTVSGALPIIAISRHYGSQELGQFALVMSTIFLPSGLVGAAIGQVYYQRAALAWAERQRISSLWSHTAVKLIGIGVPVYGLIALISPYAYPLIFGPVWQQAGEFAVWMSVAAFFSFVSSPLDRTSLIVGVWWYPMVWGAIRAILGGAVVVVAWFWQWPITLFVPALALQLCLAYLVDFFVGLYLSKVHP